ncbi:MAG: hypothetical protein ACJA2M_001931 [Polaribacter sp.]|jgi:hypothetical protein
METVLRSIVTLSVTINCSYDTAFEYLSKPLNQKEWAIHFFQDIEEIDGKIMATLPFGKLSMEIKSDYETGILDIYLGDGKPTRTRLINIEEGLNMYNFTLAQPTGMPNEVWNNKALIDMQDELNTLKSILENK